MKNLGFGMMRLPVKSGPTDFDYDQLNAMVDAFLEAGYTYFDTSFVYHNGESETAVRKALIERHPRDSFTVATKFPTFNLVPENEIEDVFQSQLDKLGVEYIDYYLLQKSSLTVNRTKETAMLCDPAMRSWLEEHDVEPITFDDVK